MPPFQLVTPPGKEANHMPKGGTCKYGERVSADVYQPSGTVPSKQAALAQKPAAAACGSAALAQL